MNTFWFGAPLLLTLFLWPAVQAAAVERLMLASCRFADLTRGARADPIVVLQGGPGEDAISPAGYFAERYAPLLDDRDLLLVDQRGTGKSGALPCTLYSSVDPAVSLRDVFPVAALKRCAQGLQARADLTQYTFDRFAGDLEQVRRKLGYCALNPYAGSFGTRAAQVYMRSFIRNGATASRSCTGNWCAAAQ